MKKAICGLVLVSIGLMGSAFAGGGTLDPRPPTHGGGGSGGGGGGTFPPSRPDPIPTQFNCISTIFILADAEAEGRVEVLASASHARYSVGVPVMCEYRVDSVEVNGEVAQAAEPLMLESYRAGRIFLSLIKANGEKVRLSIQLKDMHSPATLSYFVVKSFEAADLYQPLRRVDSEDVKVTLSSSKTTVPVQP